MTFTPAELRLLAISDRLADPRIRTYKKGSRRTAVVGQPDDHGHWLVCVCETCGARFHRARSDLKGHVYCSARCCGLARRKPDALERLRASKREYARRKRAEAKRESGAA